VATSSFGPLPTQTLVQSNVCAEAWVGVSSREETNRKELKIIENDFDNNDLDSIVLDNQLTTRLLILL